jgi:hypothetical protein
MAGNAASNVPGNAARGVFDLTESNPTFALPPDRQAKIAARTKFSLLEDDLGFQALVEKARAASGVVDEDTSTWSKPAR